MGSDGQFTVIHETMRTLTCSRCYTNDIIKRDHGQDPLQTASMADREATVWSECQLLRGEYQRHSATDEDGDWIPEFLGEMKQRKEEVLDHFHLLGSVEKNMEEDHYCRRVIAFYHQQDELLAQGGDVWDMALEDGALIMQGRQ